MTCRITKQKTVNAAYGCAGPVCCEMPLYGAHLTFLGGAKSRGEQGGHMISLAPVAPPPAFTPLPHLVNPETICPSSCLHTSVHAYSCREVNAARIKAQFFTSPCVHS